VLQLLHICIKSTDVVFSKKEYLHEKKFAGKMRQKMNLGIVVVGRCQVLGHAAELVVHLLADVVGPHAGAVVEELLARSDVHQLQIRKRNADVIISIKAFRTASVNTS